jgi:putative endonuclease
LHTRYKGNIAENRAVEFLEDSGYEIVDRNFYTKFGEIDIIAKKDNIFHFIEVKSGIGFEPIYNVTSTKLKRIINSLNVYLKKHKIKNPYQIDVIIVKDDIKFIKNVTI